MKKSLLLLTALLLSACALTKLSPVDYNNRVVEQINTSSSALEASASLYNQVIPDVVTEEVEIESKEMKASLNEAKQALKQSESLLNLQSRDQDQELSSEAALETYLSSAQNYLSSYEEMLTYYDSESYKEDLTQVQTLDETLHTHYTTFIEANNDLVDTLEKYVE